MSLVPCPFAHFRGNPKFTTPPMWRIYKMGFRMDVLAIFRHKINLSVVCPLTMGTAVDSVLC